MGKLHRIQGLHSKRRQENYITKITRENPSERCLEDREAVLQSQSYSGVLQALKRTTISTGWPPDKVGSYISPVTFNSASCSDNDRDQVQQREKPFHTHSHTVAYWWISQCNCNCYHTPPFLVSRAEFHSFGSKAHMTSSVTLSAFPPTDPPLTSASHPTNTFLWSLGEAGKSGG